MSVYLAYRVVQHPSAFNIWKHFENEKGSVNQKYIQVTLMIYDVVHRFNRSSHMFLYVWVKDKQHVNRI